MARRLLLRALALVALVLTGAIFAVAAPAQASPDPLVVSPDGVSYADALPASLFDGVLIVPGRSVTRTFWVKNQYSEPGNLAIALTGVTSTSAAFKAALKLQLHVGSAAGPSVALSAADPCVSLASGVLLGAGSAVRVDATLSLAPGLAGGLAQTAVGGFDLPLLLTSTDVDAPDGCASTPPVAPPPGGDGETPPTPGTGTIGTVLISGAASGALPVPGTDDGQLQGLGGKGTVRTFAVIPNTGRFWQEIDISGYFVLMVLGGVFAWRWRRRDAEVEVYA